MRKTVFTLTVFLTLFLSLMVGVQTVIAPYVSEGVSFNLAGPINIISPCNITYNTNDLLLNVTSNYLLGPEYANLCYSIDGTSNVTIPLTGTLEPREVEITFENGTVIIVNTTKYSGFTLNGFVVLSELSEGPHHIIVYANYTANTVISYYESEIYFTIDTNSEISFIPEFPSWTILPLILVATLAVIIYRKRLPEKSSN